MQPGQRVPPETVTPPAFGKEKLCAPSIRAEYTEVLSEKGKNLFLLEEA
jgi:hypothetical protein